MVKSRIQTPFKPRSPVKKVRKNKSAKPKSKQSDDDGKNFIQISKKSAVMYLGNIPHGFYDQEMRKYFSQFGKVLRTRVARSRNTGRSKGYGFIEFADADVAKIVSETVNNYIMNKRILKAKIIPPEDDHGKYFLGHEWSEKKYPALYARKQSIQKKNKRINTEKEEQLRKRKLNSLEKIKNKLQEMGYEWEPEMVGLPSKKNSPSKVVEVSSEKSSISSENDDESDENEEEADSSDNDNVLQMESENDDSEESENAFEQDSEESSEQENSDEQESDDESEEEEPKFSKKSKSQYTKLMQRKSGGGVTKRSKAGQIFIKPRQFKMAANETVKKNGKSFNKKKPLVKKSK